MSHLLHDFVENTVVEVDKEKINPAPGSIMQALVETYANTPITDNTTASEMALLSLINAAAERIKDLEDYINKDGIHIIVEKMNKIEAKTGRKVAKIYIPNELKNLLYRQPHFEIDKDITKTKKILGIPVEWNAAELRFVVGDEPVISDAQAE